MLNSSNQIQSNFLDAKCIFQWLEGNADECNKASLALYEALVEDMIIDELDTTVQDKEEEDGDDYLEDGHCVLCERETSLTAHHLIPRELHERYMKKGLSREHVCRTIDICRPCHNALHRYSGQSTSTKFFGYLFYILRVS